MTLNHSRMLLNRTFGFISLAFLSFSFQQKDADPKRIAIDTNNSTIEWTGKKLTGEHYGNVSISDGHLLVDGNKLTGGVFEIDMNSITCTDITDEKSNKRLVDHLTSEDFFAVSKFPKARFEITVAKHDGKDNYSITGNLTIKGKTNPLTFPVTFIYTDGIATAAGDLVFDRSKYDVKFGSQSFFENLGDKMVYDDVEMKVSIVSKR